MQFKISGKDPVRKVLWPEESVYKATGGFTLVKADLPDGADFLPKGTLMSVNFATRDAKVVKTAIIHEAAADNATSYKVEKNHLLKVGDILTSALDGAARAISAINKTSSAYDEITVTATLGIAVPAGAILIEAAEAGTSGSAEKNVANSILIHDTELQETTTLNVGLQIFEIIEANLPFGVSAVNKESLTSRFHFV
jgi:hypothetical protein